MSLGTLIFHLYKVVVLEARQLSDSAIFQPAGLMLPKLMRKGQALYVMLFTLYATMYGTDSEVYATGTMKTSTSSEYTVASLRGFFVNLFLIFKNVFSQSYFGEQYLPPD